MVQIAIIGGGIGGLTAALALQQSGFQAEVFEQAPELLEVGAAIAIWSNATRVLQRLQLAEKILECAGVVEELRWMDQNGFLLNRVSIADDKSPALALHRSDLQRTLRQALPQSTIHLGHTLVAHRQQGDKMIATFANGNSVESDFLIGADGVHSRVRAQFINDGEPVSRGYTIWRGTSPITPAAIPPGVGMELYGRGKRFGIGPVGLGRTGWWAAANADNTDQVTDLFADWYAPVMELIAATPPSSILKTGATDRQPNKNWGTGRMTLLGDAIHPTTPNLGQGGCQAMEDALVLARCFEKYGPTEDALRNYEHLRHARTATLTKISRYYGRVGQLENTLARIIRRTALALPPEAILRRSLRFVFDYEVQL
ncbi:MAG TPA: FAD-dependent monooxygenase [Pyrinomonadaceae bacterium]|jgi:2-polyprenyl-6-methoxyphenol hydroxylase-like FAD-dependent oxidoreductase